MHEAMRPKLIQQGLLFGVAVLLCAFSGSKYDPPYSGVIHIISRIKDTSNEGPGISGIQSLSNEHRFSSLLNSKTFWNYHEENNASHPVKSSYLKAGMNVDMLSSSQKKDTLTIILRITVRNGGRSGFDAITDTLTLLFLDQERVGRSARVQELRNNMISAAKRPELANHLESIRTNLAEEIARLEGLPPSEFIVVHQGHSKRLGTKQGSRLKIITHASADGI
jgi:hypothetical protein